MVTTKTGDLFSSGAQTLVNTVNCVGVMGKGIALAFKNRFPEMYKEYVRLCGAKRVRLGEPYMYKQLTGPWVLNFPTKDHWRSVSRLSDIVAGLTYLEQHYGEWGITSLAVPPLGCGQGGLEWRIVGPTLYRHLSRLDMPVELYAPHGTAPSELTPEFLGSDSHSDASSSIQYTAPLRISASWLALVEILHRIVAEPYHWPVGRTTFQKIAYFATESGIPTGLKFVKGSYGPFSADVKPMLSKLVNNGLIEEEQLGRMLSVRPGRTFADARKLVEPVLEQWDGKIENVADLFLRVQTHQAEIAASVMFAAQTLDRTRGLSEYEVFQAVMEWKQKRRPPLKPEEVAQSIRHLNMLEWINLQPSDQLPIASEG